MQKNQNAELLMHMREKVWAHLSIYLIYIYLSIKKLLLHIGEKVQAHSTVKQR